MVQAAPVVAPEKIAVGASPEGAEHGFVSQNEAAPVTDAPPASRPARAAPTAAPAPAAAAFTPGPTALSLQSTQLLYPNVDTALAFIEEHLGTHRWFAGEHLTMADFQMCFAVEALMSRANHASRCPHLQTYLERMHARPAYQRGIAKGGPVVIEA